MTTRAAIEAVWRIESARLIAALARRVHDVGLAEDLAQEALVIALERWRDDGIPANPGAWLMTTAKNRGLDLLRRDQMRARKHAVIEGEAPSESPDLETALDDHVGDDLLRLILVACHPVLSMEGRVALVLKLVCGLTTEEIARAFLAPEPTIAQRIVRAKRTLTEAGVPFEVPRGDALKERLAGVLEVVYLVFNEGYASTRGDDWMRPELCSDALRLGRILVGLVPDEAEAHGLLALMELHQSRARARVGADGQPVRLLEQDRGKWDHVLVQRGLAGLRRAQGLAGSGAYTLQAAIVAEHARARTPEATDWAAIVRHYDGLLALTGSPVVALNRAVALSMAEGPAAALEIVEGLALPGYPLKEAVRGDLLERLGRVEEAREAFLEAAEGTSNEGERAVLRKRAERLEN